MGINQKLLDNCMAGNLENVKSAIQNGANVNTKDPTGNVPLSLAIEYCHLEIVRLLLSKKANITQTCVLRAIAGKANKEQLEIVELLLRNGMDVNSRVGPAAPILTLVADPKTMKLLISHGADINAVDATGETPLHYTCYFSREEAKQVLLDAGADTTIVSKEGYLD